MYIKSSGCVYISLQHLKKNGEAEVNPLNNNFSKLLIIGTLIITSTILLSAGFNEGYTFVSSIQPNDISNGDSAVNSDPFGYYMGKWNLWEYIGDSVSSLFQ